MGDEQLIDYSKVNKNVLIARVLELQGNIKGIEEKMERESALKVEFEALLAMKWSNQITLQL